MTWRPYHPRSIEIEPIQRGGFTAEGIYLDHHPDFPPVHGFVVAVARGVTEVKPGDIVIFTDGALDSTTDAAGKTHYFLSTREALCVFEGWDDYLPTSGDGRMDA